MPIKRNKVIILPVLRIIERLPLRGLNASHPSLPTIRVNALPQCEHPQSNASCQPSMQFYLLRARKYDMLALSLAGFTLAGIFTH